MNSNVHPLVPQISGEMEDSADCGPREWFSAAELAELALPGLPGDKRSLTRRARDEHWHLKADSSGEPLSRPRIGRGGGTEFHVTLLPAPAQLELAKRGITPGVAEAALATPPVATGWRWYEGQSAKVKAEAERRMGIVSEIDLLESAGLTRSAALAEVRNRHGIAISTLWNWLRLIEGVARADRLPALAPRRQGGGSETEIDPLLWSLFKSDYLRASAPTLTSCYERVRAIAAERGLSMPSEKTMRRRLERDVDPRVILLRRKGEEALRRSLPAQRRTVSDMHALELVNIDGHKFDVFARTSDGRVVRPLMVAIQDIYSRKFVAWRVCEVESAMHVRLAFATLFERFGIPKGCVLDNGRGFASKWITGGAKNRFRFKVKPEDPTGLLTSLGIEIHWTLPYRGQSKPIERGFRDLCDTIAKHPAMEGAYTGNTVLAKPENYGSRAVAWDEFVALVDQGMAAHNAKLGRRTETARGRSFDEAFAESYARAPIGKATPEQLRMALLAAEQVRVDRKTSAITLFDNRYWSDGCAQIAGQLVTVRFDPDDLMQDIHLYAQDGRYLTSAQLIADTGFLDVNGAKRSAKQLAEYRRKIREAAEAEQLMAADEVARLQADAPTFTVPEPSVVRPVRHRGHTAAALKLADAAPARAAEERTDRIFTAMERLKLVE